MAYDPAPDLREIGCPVLAVTGCKDIQVDHRDLARIADLVGSRCDLAAPPTLTHVLRCTARPPSLWDYARQLREPVDADLVALVSDWVGQRLVSPGEHGAPGASHAPADGDESGGK